MRKKILILVNLLAIVTLTHAQRYLYVRDNDLYINVRSAASAQANIVDTLYNLQVVKVTEEPTSENGWLSVSKNNDLSGFVHQSRLIQLPQKYDAILDSLWSNGHGETYIAAADCPEIAVSISTYKKLLVEGLIETRNTDTRKLEIATEEATIVNLKTGEQLDYYSPITPVDITLYSSRMVFSNPWYIYSFYRNREDRLCRGLLFLSSYDAPKLSATELTATLDKAKRAADAAKHSDPQSDIEKRAVRDAVSKHIHVNDFDFLNKIEYAYFNRNNKAKELYPYLLKYFPRDGEGTHAIESYFIRFWGFENRGEVQLENENK